MKQEEIYFPIWEINLFCQKYVKQEVMDSSACPDISKMTTQLQ